MLASELQFLFYELFISSPLSVLDWLSFSYLQIMFTAIPSDLAIPLAEICPTDISTSVLQNGGCTRLFTVMVTDGQQPGSV